MYKLEKSITLVTTASASDQNLALNTYDLVAADTLASIHEGYISVIPLINLNRRCRYVPICDGKNRGKGTVKQIKWLKFNNEVLFIIASTTGLQVYDVEVYNLKFFHSCKTFKNFPDYINGLCVIEDNILCVGTNLGIIFLFRYNTFNTFVVVDCFKAHADPIMLLDGKGKYLVSSSSKTIYLWIKDKQFAVSRQIYVEGLLSTPTVLTMTKMLILIGYESGEFCIFDILDSDFLVHTVAHKLKVSGIDFCKLNQLILTGSEDSYIKLWSFHRDKSEATCVYAVVNKNGPVCGVGFLNEIGSEFCVVTVNCIQVNIYSKNVNAN